MASRVLSLALCALAVTGARSDTVLLQLQPPYRSFDGAGSRTLAGFNYGGETTALENFVRLTPDRASKRGWLWADRPLNVTSFSATLTFRVSGQGSQLFGDGLALWFVSSPTHVDGPLHGFGTKFTGFGVVLDTFVNAENAATHKDVALIVGTGEVRPAAHGTGFEGPAGGGCDANYRFHEGRDDFNAADVKSRLRVVVTDGWKVTVGVDAAGSGSWVSCVSETPLAGLPEAWAALPEGSSIYVGVTATTGQLADNHDVLSLVGLPAVDAAIAAAVAAEGERAAAQLLNMHHHLEHQLAAVRDALQNTLAKLQTGEKDNLRRIEALEVRLAEKLAASVDSRVDKSMESRLSFIEAALNRNFEKKFKDELAPGFENSVAERVAARGDARSWVIPFAVMSVIGLACAACIGVQYQRIHKTLKKHHLP